jgi:hypothetical protein
MADAAFVNFVLELIVAADEACAGIGIPKEEWSAPGGYFEFLCEAKINDNGTLCRFISSRSLRVLPKQHTPQSGFNIRCLTHHLALCSASEVEPVWTLAPLNAPSRVSFNVLLAPWPLSIEAIDIVPASRTSNSPEKFGYFDYAPNLPVADREVLASAKRLVDGARRIGQAPDMLVFPECALTLSQWGLVSRFCADEGMVCISGVRVSPSKRAAAQNSLRIKLPFDRDFELAQMKHHRWQINDDQIRTYGLGGSLKTGVAWWENIPIYPRTLNFLALRSDLLVCPLICEDLARQDPVAELVRSIGPNLVVALLMDGPQLPARWAARYATVLADDPGCSVLTLTSFGMVRRSRPDNCEQLSTVASWKDSTGRYVELKLDAGQAGLLLNLQFSINKEWSVDGRDDGEVSSTPVLCGVHPISEELPK